PAWMFDLPERAYAWRVELRERLAALPALPWDTIKLAGVNPLPAYLAAGLRLPDAWSEALPGWRRYLFDRILPVDGVRATLPRVVLSVLDLFLHSLSVPLTGPRSLVHYW